MKTIAQRMLSMVIGISLLSTGAVLADPGQGVAVGTWALSPYVDLNITHDSNVHKTRDGEIADTFVEPELGLRFSSSSEPMLMSLLGNLFYSRREYASEDDLSFDTFGDSVSFQYGTEETCQIELIQSFRRLKDNDRHASDIEDSSLSADMVQDIHTLSAQRDVHQAGVAVARNATDKIDLRVSYRFADTTYDKNEFLDLDGHLGRVEAAYLMTDRSSAFLNVGYGLQNQEGTDGSAKRVTARLGLETKGTEKLTYKAAGGVQRYTRPTKSGDESTDAFSFEASASWFATEQVTLRCGGQNGTQRSSFYSGNGLDYISGWAGVGYRWSPRITLSARGVYRQDDYLDPVAVGDGTIDRKDERAEGHARIDHVAPSNALRLYLEVSQEYVDSNIDSVDYEDTRVILGATVRY